MSRMLGGLGLGYSMALRVAPVVSCLLEVAVNR